MVTSCFRAFQESEDDCRDAKPVATRINLRRYEVLVDMADSEWGFTLHPTSDGARSWRLRAPSEELRLQWCLP